MNVKMTAKLKLIYFNKIFIFVHEGVYGATSGAGNSNARFLKVLLKNYPKTYKVIGPIKVDINSPFFNSALYNATKKQIEATNGIIEVVNNGTAGTHPFGTMVNWKIASETSLLIVNKHIGKKDKVLVISIDTPFAFLIQKLVNINNVTHIHIPRSTGIVQNPNDLERINFEKLALRAVNNHIKSYVGATSTYMSKHLSKDYGVKKSKILKITNGVLLQNQKKYRQNTIAKIEQGLGIPSNTKYIFSYGRGVKYKGFHLVLKALAKMDSKYRPFFLIIAAEFFLDSAYIKYLRRLISKLDLKGVLLTRFNLELPQILQQSNNLLAVIVPSIEEPFGLIPIENFANKLSIAPVIAANSGGLKNQVLHEKTGYLFEKNNPLDLVKQLTKALGAPLEQKKAFKKNAMAMVRTEYDYEQNITNCITNLDKMEYSKYVKK